MTKGIAIFFATTVVVIGFACFGIIKYCSYWKNAPSFVIEDDGKEFSDYFEESSEAGESSVYDVPKIKPLPTNKTATTVKEPVTPKTTDDPVEDTIEKIDEDGNEVQTHDWAAQNTLPEGTEVKDTPEPPTYPAQSSTASSTSNSTPKNGSTKVIDGQTHTYVEGFGWVKDSGPNQVNEFNGELTGEKVGY